MKLYATTTSERASKGQGGNEYIDIDLMGENEQIIARLVFMKHEDENSPCDYLLVEDQTLRGPDIEIRARQFRPLPCGCDGSTFACSERHAKAKRQEGDICTLCGKIMPNGAEMIDGTDGTYFCEMCWMR